MATQESLFAHDVPFAAAIGTIFLLGGIKVVINAPIARLVGIHIDPSITLAVAALLLLWSGGHL